MFDRILIANRGEIACRIIDTARVLGVTSVAIYSESDRNARHVRQADEAYLIEESEGPECYLDLDAILTVANETDVDAIHPGYGFLAENPKFPARCNQSSINFIGPSAEIIEAMGRKNRAKKIMQEASVPVVPGYNGRKQDSELLKQKAEEIGYPLLIKALAGGGGKGMRLVEDPSNFENALVSCRREAESAFGDDEVLLEKYLTNPRHIEVQVFGDHHGNAVHIFERDCSLQRRYQKIVEEAPAPGIPESFRREIGRAAVRAVEELDYDNAGTLEFIVGGNPGGEDLDYYFMEMNTRLQVEHPITEMITGLDLVEWQMRVASGEPLPLFQEDLSIEGHAFEVRIYAEDPSDEFTPQTGRINRFITPNESDHVRLDTGVDDGDEVGIHYDPMIGKMIVHGNNRTQAIRRTHQALEATGIAGLTTNLEFLYNVFEQGEFQNGAIDTSFVPRHMSQLAPESYGRPKPMDLAMASVYFLSGRDNPINHSREFSHSPWSATDNWRLNSDFETVLTLKSGSSSYEISCVCRSHTYELTFEGETIIVRLREFHGDKLTIEWKGSDHNAFIVNRDGENDITLINRGRSIPFHLYIPGREREEITGDNRITASMPGKIINILVSEGETVDKNDPILVTEAMKMENTLKAGVQGIVDELTVSEGDQVKEGELLVSISKED